MFLDTGGGGGGGPRARWLSWYRLIGKRHVRCSAREHARWRTPGHSLLGKKLLPSGHFVSTVFIGNGMALFESTVFNRKGDECHTYRYRSCGDAMIGHRKLLKQARCCSRATVPTKKRQPHYPVRWAARWYLKKYD